MVKDRILIADDSKLNQELLSAILGNQYDYIYANNGLDVIDILEKNEIVDIILLDLNMPKLGGFDVLKILNERHYIDQIPVVIISVENDASFVRNAYELGATDYIMRPFNAIVVQHRVRNTLNLYSNQKRLVRLVENQIYEREKTSNAMINIFSNIIELRNHESGSHTINVQIITNMLLHELIKITDKYHLTESDISLISSLSALHDIGKISIPEAILNKPGKLTDEEWVLMKKHTIEGYEILCHTNIDQNNQFMKTAKAICRWHHEKYDGKGYPDGLKGDEIPLEAQVVSLADVYDALTSERCYKRAFTHDEAIKMILNGECGVFNPLLITALKNISLSLRETLNSGKEYDYHRDSSFIANEILSKNNLPIENNHYLIEAEAIKREFFENEASRGIQFEYDMVLHRVKLINNYDSNKRRIIYTSSNDLKIISDKDWNILKEKIRETTRINPIIEIITLIEINGIYRWHKLKARTIWPERGSSYIGILGQLTDIHEKIVNKGLITIKTDNDLCNIMKSLKSIFTVVRVVDPNSHHILEIDENGNIIDTNGMCYKIWNKKEACDNCTSLKALKNKGWFSKLELKEHKLFSVLSKYIKFKDNDCALEIAFELNDDIIKSKNRRKIISGLFCLDFYRDSLTNAYTRAYLDDFSDNLNSSKAVALLDVDHFKSINDTYGHPVGDLALKEVAGVIERIADKGTTIRYGGDEFLLIFNNITKDELYDILENITNNVEKIIIKNYPTIKLSISYGVSYEASSLQDAIVVADKEMYKKKMNR